MTVNLAPQSEDIIKRKIESGEYYSASEIIHESLRLLDERDHIRERRIAELRKQVTAGLEQLECGEYTTYTDETLPQLAEEIKAAGRKKLGLNA